MTKVFSQNHTSGSEKKAYIRPAIQIMAMQIESVCQMITGSTRVPEEIPSGGEFGEDDENVG